MDLRLKGKVAWVHGASSGLGRASAASLAREGASVALSSRHPARLRDAADAISFDTGGTVLPLPVDVTDPEAIVRGADAVRDGLGPVTICVANAGGPPAGTFDTFGDDDLFAAFTLTSASAWRITKAVVPHMRSAGGGVMLFITSGSTKEVVPGLLLSNMMRPAVVGMAKTLSKELAEDGIRVICVAPGRIETERIARLDEATSRRTGETPEQVRARNIASIPLGRYGDAGEFGDAIAFLASERASYITGVSVSVDGGALNGLIS